MLSWLHKHAAEAGAMLVTDQGRSWGSLLCSRLEQHHAICLDQLLVNACWRSKARALLQDLG